MTGYTRAIEDYLEAIFLLERRQRVVRVKDVASFLGIKNPSVVAALKSLAEKDLVEHESYGHIELTPKGRAVGEEIYARHMMLFAFFHEVLGLSPEVAEEDACRLEHHLSAEARGRILQLVEFVRACPAGEVRFLQHFQHYVRTSERPAGCSECSKCDTEPLFIP
ncbi:MAG: metal-dependent transcriptional regulator [Bacillota bacterium]